MGLPLYSTINLIIGTILVISSISIYIRGNKSSSAKCFFCFSLLTGIWGIMISISLYTTEQIYHLKLINFDHLLGTLIASSFLLFALSYPFENRIGKRVALSLIIAESIFAYLFFFTDQIVVTSFPLPNENYLGWSYGSLAVLFNLHFIICWSVGIGVLFRKFLYTHEAPLRKTLRLVIVSLIIGVIPPGIFTILMPQIGIYNFYWLSPVSSLIWILIVAYSITKHHLFNIKIIAIELMTFSLWIFIMIHIMLSETTHDLALQIAMLLVTIIFGISLIRSALTEIAQREKIDTLTKDLKEALGVMKSGQKISDRI